MKKSVLFLTAAAMAAALSTGTLFADEPDDSVLFFKNGNGAFNVTGNWRVLDGETLVTPATLDLDLPTINDIVVFDSLTGAANNAINMGADDLKWGGIRIAGDRGNGTTITGNAAAGFTHKLTLGSLGIEWEPEPTTSNSLAFAGNAVVEFTAAQRWKIATDRLLYINNSSSADFRFRLTHDIDARAPIVAGAADPRFLGDIMLMGQPLTTALPYGGGIIENPGTTPRTIEANRFVMNKGARDTNVLFRGTGSITLAGDIVQNLVQSSTEDNGKGFYNELAAASGEDPQPTLTLGTQDTTIAMYAQGGAVPTAYDDGNRPANFSGTGKTIFAGRLTEVVSAAETVYRSPIRAGQHSIFWNIIPGGGTLCFANKGQMVDDVPRHNEIMYLSVVNSVVDIDEGVTIDAKRTTAGDVLVISNAGEVNLHGTFKSSSAGNVSLSSGGSLLIPQSGRLEATGNLNINSGSTVDVKGTFTNQVLGNLVSVGAPASVSILKITAPSSTGTATVSTAFSEGTLNIASGGSFTTRGKLTVNGTMKTAAGSAVTVANYEKNEAGLLQTISAVAAEFSGADSSAEINGDMEVSGALTVSSRKGTTETVDIETVPTIVLTGEDAFIASPTSRVYVGRIYDASGAGDGYSYTGELLVSGGTMRLDPENSGATDTLNVPDARACFKGLLDVADRTRLSTAMLTMDGPNAHLITKLLRSDSERNGILWVKNGAMVSSRDGNGMVLDNYRFRFYGTGDGYFGSVVNGKFKREAIDFTPGGSSRHVIEAKEGDATYHADFIFTGNSQLDIVGKNNLHLSGDIAVHITNAGLSIPNALPAAKTLTLGHPGAKFYLSTSSVNGDGTTRNVTFSGTGKTVVLSDMEDREDATVRQRQVQCNGPGLLEFAGYNTYRQGTTVNAGAELRIAKPGRHFGLSTVNISGAGAVLGGDGTLGSSATISSGAVLAVEGLTYDGVFLNPETELDTNNILTVNAGATIRLDGNKPIHIASGRLTVNATAVDCLGVAGSWAYSAASDSQDCVTVFTYDPENTANITITAASVNLTGAGSFSETTNLEKEVVSGVETGRVYLVGVTKHILMTDTTKIKMPAVPTPADSVTVEVASNVSNWVAEPSAAWIKIADAEESGEYNGELDDEFTVTAEENTNLKERVGTITISGGSASDFIIQVTQAGAAAKLEPAAGSASVVKEWQAGATSVTLDVVANIPWGAAVTSSNTPWITFETSSGNTGAAPAPGTYPLKFNLAENEGLTDITGEITVKGIGVYSGVSYTIPVTMKAFKAELEVDPSTIDLAWSDTTPQTVTVDVNMTWTVAAEYPSGTTPWLTLSTTGETRTKGTPVQDTFDITATANTSLTSTRTATVKVTAGTVVKTIELTQGVWKPTLRVTPNKKRYEWDGTTLDTREIILESNATWKVTPDSKATWLRIDKLTDMSDTPRTLESNGTYIDPNDAVTKTKILLAVAENTDGAPRRGVITFEIASGIGTGMKAQLTVTQGPTDLAKREEYSVYDTKIAARTTVMKTMKPKLKEGGTAEISFRAPVTKAYTLLMAYNVTPEGTLDYATKGKGVMWAKNGKEFEIYNLAGEYLKLHGKDGDSDAAFMGAKGINIPESGYYWIVDGDGNKLEPEKGLRFEGMATRDAKAWRLASGAGMLHGMEFEPFGQTATNEQGTGRPTDASKLIGNLYYPQSASVKVSVLQNPEELDDTLWVYEEEDAPAPAHFYGTYTTRYNKKRSDDVKGAVDPTNVDSFPTQVQNFMKGKWKVPQP